MAEDRYVIRSGEQGDIEIATDVIAEIAGIAAFEVEGVSSIAGGITKSTIGKQSSKNLSKGIRLDLTGDGAVIDIALNLDYGSSIPKVTAAVQERIKNTVSNMTGLEIADVNVKVIGIEEV